jgi:cytochrome c5
MKQTLSSETARVRRGQLRAVVLGVGVSAMALACSFGEIDNGPSEIDPPSNQNDVTNAPTSPGEEESTATPGNPGGRNQPGPAAGDDKAAADPNDPFATTELGKEVKQILEVNCGACHAGTKSGDMDYILNLQELIKNDKVVPGKKEDSQLFVRMQQGSMPPAFQRTQRPTFGQIDQVGQFIDELDPAVFDPDAAKCETVPFLSSDEQISLMANDIARLDSKDQPFTRYLTITYSSNAGGCEGPRKDLERQRFALFKGINSVSTETTVGIPEPIDQAQTIYRIDIRDYNWDRGIDIEDDGVQDFNDGWDAIVAGVQGQLVQGNLPVNPNSSVLAGNNAYAVEYVGDQADDLKADSGTAVPFLPVNAFIQASEFADLYYSLIGAKANIFDFEKEVLLIDTVQEKEDDNLLRAGFSNSGVSKQERVLNRFDQGTAGGYSYWLSFDFDGGSGTVNGNLVRDLANDSIYSNPIDFLFTGGEAIFNLPNGFQGYYVANAAGVRLAEAPVGIVIDPAQNNGTVTNGASCHSCHNAGMITFTDTVRPYVEANRQDFDNETYEHVINQYPKDPNQFQRVMDEDSAVHVNAVVKSGIPKGTPDAVSRVYLDFQFNVNITAKLAAGELGVTEEELISSINDLDPSLANLADPDGYVSREVFSANFLDSLCQLHTADENQPANCP